MARTYEQLYGAALAQRRRAVRKGCALDAESFACTNEEYDAILDRPPFMNYELSAARDRICGLRIVIEDGSPSSAGEKA